MRYFSLVLLPFFSFLLSGAQRADNISIRTIYAGKDTANYHRIALQIDFDYEGPMTKYTCSLCQGFTNDGKDNNFESSLLLLPSVSFVPIGKLWTGHLCCVSYPANAPQNPCQYTPGCCDQCTYTSFEAQTHIQVPPLSVTILNKTAASMSWLGDSVYRNFQTLNYTVEWGVQAPNGTYLPGGSTVIFIPEHLQTNQPPLSLEYQGLTITEGLITGEENYFRVKAGNIWYETEWSEQFALVGQKPDPPNDPVLAVVDRDTMEIAFGDGVENGAPITSYDVVCDVVQTLNNGPVWFFDQTNGSYLTLIRGQTYYCAVRVTNVFGTSSTGVPSPGLLLATAPGAPELNTITALSPESFSVGWFLGADLENGAPITSLKLQFASNNGFSDPVNVTFSGPTGINNTYIVTSNVTAPKDYYVRLLAVNVKGEGSWSNTLSLTLPALPSFTASSLTTNSSGAQSTEKDGRREIVLPSTTRGQWITIKGAGFDAYGAPFVFYKNNCTGAPNLCQTYECENVTVVGDDLSCQLQGGVGTEFHFFARSGPFVSPSASQDYINFPKPTITPNTLRHVNGANEVPLICQTDGEVVIFNGAHFGTNASLVRVTLEPAGKVCIIKEISDSEISCYTPTGSPDDAEHQIFRVNVSTQSEDGADTYNFQGIPTITSVSGCSGTCSNASYTCGCPTGGNIPITINGLRLYKDVTHISVRGLACASPTYNPPSQITCTLPAGTGSGLPIVATQGIFSSSTFSGLSYGAPILTSATGCTQTTFPENCSRTDQTDVVTINGANFGASGARAFVGGKECVQTVTVIPHTQLTCVVPVGFGTKAYLSVIQKEGVINEGQSVYLAYEVCPPGTFSEGENCTPCPVGTANPLSDQPLCPLCPVGRYQDEIGQENCVVCPDGTGHNNDIEGNTFCPNCTAGSYRLASTGIPYCSECAPGFFAENNGTAECDACPLGRWQDGPGAVACDECLAGQETAPGAISCVECDNGYYNPTAGSPLGCIPAPAGAFAVKSSNGRGATFAAQCPAGRYSSADGISCPNCGPGTYSPTAGANSCALCPPGNFSAVEESTRCEPCPGGQFNNYAGASLCFGCDFGTFSHSAATTCTQCDPGYYNSVQNATTCDPCAAGSAAAKGVITCTACGSGRYSPGTTEQHIAEECIACAAGRYARNESSVGCPDCSPGYASTAGSQACLVCGVGYFTNGSRAATCSSCPAGTFGAAEGLNGCTQCNPGYFSGSSGQKACTPCAPGTFQDQKGASSCELCAFGYYAEEEGSTVCVGCPEGKVADPNGLGCLDLYYQTEGVKFFFLVVTLGSLGTVVASYLFLIFYREHRVIHHSQPLVLWVMLFGFALIFISMILWLWDQTPYQCLFRNITLNLGVDIVLVPLTLKTWRLHRVFNRSRKDALQTVVIHNWMLAAIFFTFVLYDIITFASWWGVSPFSVFELIGRCDSKAEPWIHAVLWWWKPIVCIYLAYLVFRLRDVNERFNESWWIGIGLYNALVVMGVLAVLTYSLNLSPRNWHIFFVVIIFYLAISTWALIYLVKWYQIYRKDEDDQKILGTVASDETPDEKDTEEALDEEKKEEEETEKPTDATAAGGDPELAKLEARREKKARDLTKLLQVVDRTKQRMKHDIANLNHYTSEVMALHQEIEYRKKMLKKGGVIISNKEKKQETLELQEIGSEGGEAAGGGGGEGGSDYGSGGGEDGSGGYGEGASGGDSGGSYE